MSTKSFGSILKTARKAKRVTLRDLSAAVSLAPSYLSELENGIRPAPKEGILEKIATALDIQFCNLKKAAEEDLFTRNPTRLKNLFNADNELATSFYRVSSELSDAELKEMIMQMIQRFDKGDDTNDG